MSTPFKFHDENDIHNIVLLLRAIWLLYKRQRWKLLAELGLPKELYLQQFVSVEMSMHRSSPGEKESTPTIQLSHPRHIALLIEVEGVVEAAINLQARYLEETGLFDEQSEEAEGHETGEESG